MRALFALNKLVPDSVWMRALAREAPDRIQGAKFMVNHVYRDGMVFLVKYNPGWRAADAERRRSIADFIARRGGSLGLISVQGSRDRHRRTCHPPMHAGTSCSTLRRRRTKAAGNWATGRPSVSVAAEQDAIHHLVWEVESLAEAYQVLGDMGLLGRVLDEEIRIKRDMMGGLDIRLVEVGIPQ